jgi:hypothetical protein
VKQALLLNVKNRPACHAPNRREDSIALSDQLGTPAAGRYKKSAGVLPACCPMAAVTQQQANESALQVVYLSSAQVTPACHSAAGSSGQPTTRLHP